VIGKCPSELAAQMTWLGEPHSRTEDQPKKVENLFPQQANLGPKLSVLGAWIDL